MAETTYDVCVIGSGPGGYVAAIRSAQLGLKTVIVEREKLGGVCLNVGCIPSKAMIAASHFYHKLNHSASEMGIEIKGSVSLDFKKLKSWKQSVCDKMSGGVQQLLKGNQAEVVLGEASFVSATELTVKSTGGERRITAKNFIVATGSRPVEIPGFKFDEKFILSSTGALDLEQIPKKLVVIGGGYIGLEIGSYLAHLGTEVTVLEAGQQLLSGLVDSECVQVVQKKLQKAGVKIHFNAKATGSKAKDKGIEVSADINGEKQMFPADKVLVTVGRRPNSDQMNLQKIGVAVDERGFIKVNAQRRTQIPTIFAIGDIACQPMLAHKASHEGVMVAEIIAGKNRAFDAKTVPAVIFTDPEIASVGWTEKECAERGLKNLKIGKFPFAANGRAVSLMETDGFVKIIGDENGLVRGVHIVGPEASNMISEAALAIEMGARLEDIALTIHPHPTLGETMMEAAEAALGHAIHIIQRPLRSKSPDAAPSPK